MDFIRGDYEKRNYVKGKYLEDIKNIVARSNASLEGNSFYYHMSLTEFPELYSKQLNLYWCGQQANQKICEIGFNAGHSTMLMLLGRSNTTLDFTIFDIGSHAYMKPCFEYIKTKFTHVNFELVEGDSTMTMPEWINKNKEMMNTYDVVHVDGGHSEYCITNDMKNTDLLLKKNGIVIVDDTNSEVINKCVDSYLLYGNYIELSLLPTYGYPHRVIKKIK